MTPVPPVPISSAQQFVPLQPMWFLSVLRLSAILFPLLGALPMSRYRQYALPGALILLLPLLVLSPSTASGSPSAGFVLPLVEASIVGILTMLQVAQSQGTWMEFIPVGREKDLAQRPPPNMQVPVLSREKTPPIFPLKQPFLTRNLEPPCGPIESL